jgi:hypothetical protein
VLRLRGDRLEYDATDLDRDDRSWPVGSVWLERLEPVEIVVWADDRPYRFDPLWALSRDTMSAVRARLGEPRSRPK